MNAVAIFGLFAVLLTISFMAAETLVAARISAPCSVVEECGLAALHLLRRF